ncbi:fucolectin-6-like [Amphiura filiformis]|uniref:fucolectin-6-like n=1 Tax=Amphiura filiformis TaxID=82378 RepID=UPI003B2164FD
MYPSAASVKSRFFPDSGVSTLQKYLKQLGHPYYQKMRLFLIISLLCGIAATQQYDPRIGLQIGGIQSKLDGIIALIERPYTSIDLTGATANQSSSQCDWSYCQATNAIDGNTDGIYQNGSCAHTASEPYPWWELTLPTSTCIYSVSIFNRKDCCRARLADAKIYISETPPNHSTRDVGTLCNTVAESDADYTGGKSYPCASPIAGRW